MRVHKSIAFILQFLIVFVISAGVLWGGWWALSVDVNKEETEQKLQMSRLQKSAQIYHSRLGYYTEVCKDIGVPEDWRCHSDETAYAIEFDLDFGHFYCMDSAGFLGETRVSKGEGVACRDY